MYERSRCSFEEVVNNIIMDSAILTEEKQLILRAKNDPEAFGVLYDRYYPHIFRFVLSRTGNYELAQDLTAETFFQALKSIWRFRLRNRPFKAWLYKIAVTQVAGFYRKKSKYCELSIDESPEIINRPSVEKSSRELPEVESLKLAEFKQVHTLLSKLKPIQHDVVILRYFEEKSLEEISTILDIKINTIKSHLRRSLVELRKLLANNNTFYKDGRSISQLEKILKGSKA
jgi:RNA polymerase sigma-70 factor, ECF subfamily